MTSRRAPYEGTPPLPSNRSFGLLFCVVFALIAAWSFFFRGALLWWAVVVSALFLGAALLIPTVLTPLNRAWMKFGEILHRIISPVILAILFFVVVTPFGLVMRVFRRDPLRLQKNASASYWITRTPPGPPPDSFDKQF
ncbi:MAG: SxtJ family membrane protein [Hyphomicrobiaceae bacterium]